MRAPGVAAFATARLRRYPRVPRGERDTPAPWLFASLHQLRLHEPEIITKSDEEAFEGKEGMDRNSRQTWYWPREVFSPLSKLLEGAFFIAPVLLQATPIPGGDLMFLLRFRCACRGPSAAAGCFEPAGCDTSSPQGERGRPLATVLVRPMRSRSQS